jgi:hypothetical protein
LSMFPRTYCILPAKLHVCVCADAIAHKPALECVDKDECHCVSVLLRL